MRTSNELKITWGTGHAYIHMDKFFPCKVTQLKKLRELIDNDIDPDARYREIADFFQNQIAVCELFSGDKQADKDKAWYEKQLGGWLNVKS